MTDQLDAMRRLTAPASVQRALQHAEAVGGGKAGTPAGGREPLQGVPVFSTVPDLPKPPRKNAAKLDESRFCKRHPDELVYLGESFCRICNTEWKRLRKERAAQGLPPQTRNQHMKPGVRGQGPGVSPAEPQGGIEPESKMLGFSKCRSCGGRPSLSNDANGFYVRCINGSTDCKARTPYKPNSREAMEYWRQNCATIEMPEPSAVNPENPGTPAGPGSPASRGVPDFPAGQKPTTKDQKPAPRLSLEGPAASRVAALIQLRKLTVQLHPVDGEELRDCIDRLAGRIVMGGS